ncbi:PIN domain-containing protein [Photobacterium leiognathi]|uniref:PIN domain-containing protein n=1 Tax=Photobacterium leiognathi TaxID=553611 RepID=UPI0029825362|nr:PIN domain-containing protein [Photobacterium leiognathi]
MKYLQNHKIAVPVYETNSQISYQTIRKPTVFEKSLLQLLVKYRNDLGNQSIDQITQELKTSSVFFIEGLRYLMDFNAVEIMHGLSLDKGGTLTLNSFDVTPSGKKFLADNALPSSNKNTSETHYYHPVLRKLVNKNGLRKDVNDDIASINPRSLDVTLAVVEGIVEERIRGEWQSKPNIRIERVKPRLSETSWDIKTISLDIDTNGNVNVTSSEKPFLSWLNAADKEFLWSQIVQGCFSNHAEIELPSFKWQQVKAIAAPVHTTRLNNIDASKLIVTRENVDVSKLPTICLAAEDDVSLSGNLLTLPKQRFEARDSLKALNIDSNFNAFEIHAGNTKVHFAGQPRHVDLAVKLSGSELWEDIKQYLLETNDVDVILFSSLLGVDQAVERLPATYIGNVKRYYDRIKNVVPDVSAKLFENKVLLVSNLEELEQYQAMFANKHLESQKLLPMCVTALIQHSLSERIVIPNLMVTPVLNELSKAYFAIQDMAGKSYFESGDLVHVTADHRLLTLITDWKAALKKLSNVVPSQCLDVPSLKLAEARIDRLEQHIVSSFAAPRADNKRVVVIDTNCLMHRLSLLDQIKSSDYLVIPAVVLDELDGLKTDKKKGEFSEKAKQARKAIDRLTRLPEGQHYEQGHLNLLKKNRNNTADAKVLSVAAYYRLGKVLLVTEDKNLRNMANAENIPTQHVNNYLGKQGKAK